jgi:hypothetical protein
MDIRDWSWTQVFLATLGYWLVLIAVWWTRTARPSRQARARSMAPSERLPGDQPGEHFEIYRGRTNVTAVATVVLGPPILLAALRALI